MFKSWMISAVYYVGILACINAVISDVSLAWVPVALLVHLVGVLHQSVGMHRLFTHRSFQAPKLIHRLLTVMSVPVGLGSPIQWAFLHHVHHANVGTNLDPHKSSGKWSALFYRQYADIRHIRPPMSVARLAKDPVHLFVHSNYTVLLLLSWVFMYAVVQDFFLYAFLPGIAITHFVACLLDAFTHEQNGAGKNLEFAEFFAPASGEWYHKDHHANPSNCKFGRLDYGYFLVCFFTWLHARFSKA